MTILHRSQVPVGWFLMRGCERGLQDPSVPRRIPLGQRHLLPVREVTLALLDFCGDYMPIYLAACEPGPILVRRLLSDI